METGTRVAAVPEGDRSPNSSSIFSFEISNHGQTLIRKKAESLAGPVATREYNIANGELASRARESVKGAILSELGVACHADDLIVLVSSTADCLFIDKFSRRIYQLQAASGGSERVLEQVGSLINAKESPGTSVRASEGDSSLDRGVLPRVPVDIRLGVKEEVREKIRRSVERAERAAGPRPSTEAVLDESEAPSPAGPDANGAATSKIDTVRESSAIASSNPGQTEGRDAVGSPGHSSDSTDSRDLVMPRSPRIGATGWARVAAAALLAVVATVASTFIPGSTAQSRGTAPSGGTASKSGDGVRQDTSTSGLAAAEPKSKNLEDRTTEASSPIAPPPTSAPSPNLPADGNIAASEKNSTSNQVSPKPGAFDWRSSFKKFFFPAQDAVVARSEPAPQAAVATESVAPAAPAQDVTRVANAESPQNPPAGSSNLVTEEVAGQTTSTPDLSKFVRPELRRSLDSARAAVVVATDGAALAPREEDEDISRFLSPGQLAAVARTRSQAGQKQNLAEETTSISPELVSSAVKAQLAAVRQAPAVETTAVNDPALAEEVIPQNLISPAQRRTILTALDSGKDTPPPQAPTMLASAKQQQTTVPVLANVVLPSVPPGSEVSRATPDSSAPVVAVNSISGNSVSGNSVGGMPSVRLSGPTVTQQSVALAAPASQLRASRAGEPSVEVLASASDANRRASAAKRLDALMESYRNSAD